VGQIRRPFRQRSVVDVSPSPFLYTYPGSVSEELILAWKPQSPVSVVNLGAPQKAAVISFWVGTGLAAIPSER
jgi:hypothetical protein